ncbi:MAG: site-specific integrase [Bacteriovoracaceae bacterium]
MWVQIYAVVLVSYLIRDNVKSIKTEQNSRGRAKRCNLDNELNLLTTIYNWYKSSEYFENEVIDFRNPVRTQHKKMGFIRPKPIKNLGIKLDDALKFFSYLKPLYRDVALFQFYTASRIGEVAGLQWKRVDFVNKKIVIMETARWDMTNKVFISLNAFPKNREPRTIYLTKELNEILQRRLENKDSDSDYVFHVEGAPLNYCTIQVNYRGAQRKAQIPYSGTHILRHGMAQLARKVGGCLTSVVAMTGHKDFRLADHYSKLDESFQKEVSLKIMDHIREHQSFKAQTEDEVIRLARFEGE